MSKQVAASFEEMSMEHIHTMITLLTGIKNNKQESETNIESFCNEYQAYIEGECSNKYYLSVKLTTNQLRGYLGEEYKLNDFSVKLAEDYISFLKSNAPRGYRVYYRNLKAAFNKAVDWGYISSNPFQKIKIRKIQEEYPATINRQELHQIMFNTTGDVLSDIFFLGYLTGLRLSEIINLRWKNIDLENRLITVGDDSFTTKSRCQRIVPLCNDLFEKLQSINPLSWGKIICLERVVFCKSNSMPFNADYVSRQFKKSCRKTGLSEKVKFHSLRHSFASNLVREGVDIYTVKELLGHSSVTVTERYAHLQVDTLKKAMEVFNNAA